MRGKMIRLFGAGGKQRQGAQVFRFFTRNASRSTGTATGVDTERCSNPTTSSTRKTTRSASPSAPNAYPSPLSITSSSQTSSIPASETTSTASPGSSSSSSISTLSALDSLAALSCTNPNPTELRKLFAQLGLSNVSPSSSSLALLRLLLFSGVSLSSLKRLSRRRRYGRIFNLPVHDVSAKIDLLGPAILSAHPSLLESRLENLQSKVEFFENLGLRVEKMTSFGRVFKVKTGTLDQRVSYLRNLGLTPDRLSLAVGRYPYILCANLERTIKPAVDFLEKDCKMSRKTVCRYITSRPCIISLSRTNLDQKAKFLESLGIDSRCPQFYSSLVNLCNLSSTRLKARIDWLMSTGFSPEAIRKFILCTPFVLCCTEANVGEKIKYLLIESNRGIEEILRYPTVLAFSLESRIKPRFAVVALLQERGLLKENLSLSYILNASNEKFNQRFVVKLHDKGALEKLGST